MQWRGKPARSEMSCRWHGYAIAGLLSSRLLRRRRHDEPRPLS